MPDGAPDPPLRVLALVVVAALGVCMMAASSMVSGMLGGFGGWPALIIGLAALVGALIGLWRIERRRDRHLG